MGGGWLIAAASSGAGKTVVTLGLMRALARRGIAVAPFKSGPDYIDPGFHAAAAGTPSLNLDAWAMSGARLRALHCSARGTVIVEGAMGLFDGAADGTGSAADLARALDLDVVLVVDCARQSHSVAALVYGFATYDPSVRVAGVVLNNVASARHERMLRAALQVMPGLLKVFGVLRRDGDLALPQRHLGLVLAGEHTELDSFLDRAADAVEVGLDMDRFAGAGEAGFATPGPGRLKPPGQRIAMARDEAFAFAYPHMLDDWRAAGAEVHVFSPLANEAPVDAADAVFLPGGYPELHAGRLANASAFREGMEAAARRGSTIYGECGGYMVLGKGVETADGTRHAMLGLLDLETSFADRKLHLGYRRLRCVNGELMGTRSFTGHEFHYCRSTREEGGALFEAEDALGTSLGRAGLRVGNVMGSWMHVIDRHAA